MNSRHFNRCVRKPETTQSHPVTFPRGYTLIEMVVVISMISIMLTLAGVITQFLLRTDQTVSQQAVLELTLLKASRQFRDDVHTAGSLRSGDNHGLSAETLELSSQESPLKVKYHIESESLIRETFDRDRFTEREIFRFPECQIQFREDQSTNQIQFISLDIDRSSLAITPHHKSVLGKHGLRVTAELARDARILKTLQQPPSTKATPDETTKESPTPAEKKDEEIQQ